MSGSQGLTVLLTVLLLVVAGLVAYAGTREREPPPPPGEPAALPEVVEGAVRSMTLPHDEPEAPPGPHREQFVVSCTLCHSARLVLTQPFLPEKTWSAVVQKMAKVYGAPITPREQKEIIAYLTAVRGKQAAP
jgi:hypothetical protein